MKKLIATIALGAFVFTSTLATTSFAADKETAESAKATTTAEDTANNTAISAAQMGSELIPVAAIALIGIGAAVAINSNDSDAPAVGHGE